MESCTTKAPWAFAAQNVLFTKWKCEKKKKHTPSYDSFGGKIFHWFRFFLFCFTLPLHLYVLIAYIYATVRQTSKNTVSSHEIIANFIYTEHGLVLMLDRNTLMQKKNHFNWLFFFSFIKKKLFFPFNLAHR